MSKWTEKDQRLFERLRDWRGTRDADADDPGAKRRKLKSRAAREEESATLDELVREWGSGTRISGIRRKQ